MPKTKHIIGTFNRGTVVEYEEVTETHWAGVVGSGPTIIRCDTSAKETGSGTWSIVKIGTGNRSSWNGIIDIAGVWCRQGFSIPFKDIVWVKDHHVRTVVYEKDYS